MDFEQGDTVFGNGTFLDERIRGNDVVREKVKGFVEYSFGWGAIEVVKSHHHNKGDTHPKWIIGIDDASSCRILLTEKISNNKKP